MALATAATGSLSLGVHKLLAQTAPATPAIQEAGWLDLAGAILKGVAVVVGVGGAGGVFAKFWARDRDEGERSRNKLIEDKDARIKRLEVQLDERTTERDLLIEERVELLTKIARLEAAEHHRTTDHGLI